MIRPAVALNAPPVAPVRVTNAVVAPEQYGEPTYVIEAVTGELTATLVVVVTVKHPAVAGTV